MCGFYIGNRFNQSPGRSGSPEDRYQGMSSRSMDVSFTRRIVLPYLICWSSGDVLSRPSTLLPFDCGDRAESSPPRVSHPLFGFAPFAAGFRFHGIAIIGSKFAAPDEARDGHGREEPATRALRAWSRDIFKRTRLVLLAHHAGPRIVIRMRARHSLDAFSTQ